MEDKSYPKIEVKILQKAGHRLPVEGDLGIKGICMVSDEEAEQNDLVEIKIQGKSQSEKIKLKGKINLCIPIRVEDERRYLLTVDLLPESTKEEGAFLAYIWEEILKRAVESKLPKMGVVERRAFPRISRRFIIRFRPKGQPEVLNWQVSVVKNISVGGCYFFSSVPYRVGQVLELGVQLPFSKEPIQLDGEVKRCEELSSAKDWSTYGIAVQFLNLSPKEKEILDSTVKYFLKRS
jgi:hypothetical protein